MRTMGYKEVIRFILIQITASIIFCCIVISCSSVCCGSQINRNTDCKSTIEKHPNDARAAHDVKSPREIEEGTMDGNNDS